MPFDGAGTFTRVMRWQSDRDAGIKIKADRHDQEDDGIAQALSNCITKDGQTQPVANLPMNGHKFTNLGEPADPGDSATKKYVDAVKSFTTGITITGADANGRVTFASATGINGLSWVGADMAFVARLAGTPANTLNQIVINDKADATGTDVIGFNDDGSISFPTIGGMLKPMPAGTPANAPARMGVFDKADTTGVERMAMGANGAVFAEGLYTITGSSKMGISIGARGYTETANNSGGHVAIRGGDASLGGARDAVDIFTGGTSTVAFGLAVRFDYNKNASFSAGIWATSISLSGSGTIQGNLTVVNQVVANVLHANAYVRGNGGLYTGQVVQSDSQNLVLAGSGGAVYMRPHGQGNPAYEALYRNDGVLTLNQGWGWIQINSGELKTMHAGGHYRTTRPSDGMFFVSAGAAKPGGGSWLNSTSDARAKEELGEFTDGLEKVLQLRPVRYRYKGNETEPGTKSMIGGLEYTGFIAQDVEKVFPTWVRKEPGWIDGKKVSDFRSLDTNELVFVLLNAVKQLSGRVEELEGMLVP